MSTGTLQFEFGGGHGGHGGGGGGSRLMGGRRAASSSQNIPRRRKCGGGGGERTPGTLILRSTSASRFCSTAASSFALPLRAMTNLEDLAPARFLSGAMVSVRHWLRALPPPAKRLVAGGVAGTRC